MPRPTPSTAPARPTSVSGSLQSMFSAATGTHAGSLCRFCRQTACAGDCVRPILRDACCLNGLTLRMDNADPSVMHCEQTMLIGDQGCKEREDSSFCLIQG